MLALVGEVGAIRTSRKASHVEAYARKFEFDGYCTSLRLPTKEKVSGARVQGLFATGNSSFCREVRLSACLITRCDNFTVQMCWCLFTASAKRQMRLHSSYSVLPFHHA